MKIIVMGDGVYPIVREMARGDFGFKVVFVEGPNFRAARLEGMGAAFALAGLDRETWREDAARWLSELVATGLPPVLIGPDLTLDETIELFDRGAWDYIVAGPLTVAGLVARVRALAARSRVTGGRGDRGRAGDGEGLMEGVFGDVAGRRRFLDALPVPVFIKDLRGACVFANSAFVSFVGQPIERLLGRSLETVFQSLLPEKRQKRIFHLEQSLLVAGKPDIAELETRAMDLSGENERHIVLRQGLLFNPAGGPAGFFGAITDFTEAQKTLSAMIDTEHRLNSALNALNELIAYHDNEFRLVWINKAAGKLVGEKKIDILGRYCYEFWFERDTPCENCPRNFGENAPQPNVEFHRGDRVFDFYCAVIYDKYGKPNGGVGVASDITDRRKAEAEVSRNRRQLFQADKLASLGAMVAGVAHEINNPMGFITMNVTLLMDCWRYALPILERYHEEFGDFAMGGMTYAEFRDSVPRMCGDMLGGVERVRNIVSSLKNFARENTGELNETVCLNTTVSAALSLTRNLIKKTARDFQLSLDPSEPAVKGNAQQLEQVFINLIVNACQAISDAKGKVRVLTEADAENGEARVIVEDEGVGIPEENMAKIFDPFFTTKGAEGGTGLGLPISLSIVGKHGGKLEIVSQPGEGTRTVIRLPTLGQPLRSEASGNSASS